MKMVIYTVLFSFMPTNIPDFYIRSTGCVEHVKKFEKIFGCCLREARTVRNSRDEYHLERLDLQAYTKNVSVLVRRRCDYSPIA
jgi:hypothetical protein